MNNKLQIRNSTAEFLTFIAAGKEDNTQFYNLDAIISVGYRVNSIRATQIRQWCTHILFSSDFDKFSLPEIPPDEKL